MRTSEVAGRAGVNSQTLLASHAELAGHLLSQDAAVQLAGAVFGSLLG